MAVLAGALSMAATATTLIGGGPTTTTVSTFPSPSTIPGPGLIPGSHTVTTGGTIDVVKVGAVAMAGSATVTAAGLYTGRAAEALTGTATLAATAFATKAGASTWSGVATLTDKAWATYEAAVTLPAMATLTSGPRAIALSTLALAGDSTLSGSALQRQFLAVALAGSGQIAGTSLLTVKGDSATLWQGNTTFVSAVAHTAVVAIAFTPAGTLTPGARSVQFMALALTGEAVLAPSPIARALAAVSMAGASSMAVDTLSVALGVATLTATAALAAMAQSTQQVAVSMVVFGTFRPDLRLLIMTDPLTMVATAGLGPSVLVIVKVAETMFAAVAGMTVLTPSVYPLVPPGFSPGPIRPPGVSPVWRLYVADTLTGRVGYELPITTMTWQSRLNDIGTAQATVDVDQAYDFLSDQDERDPRVLFRQFLSGAYRYSLCFAYGDTAVWAGPYTPGTVPSNSPTVQVGASEFMYMFTKRLLLGSRTDPTSTAGDIGFGPTTKADIAFQMLKLGTQGGPSYSLPWSCANPPPTNGGESRLYHGYDFATVWEELSFLSSEADGPDVRFDPVLNWRPDGLYLTYQLQIGTPLLGSLTPWAWDVPASATVQWDTNVQNMASVYYGLGSGQDREKIWASASNDQLTELGFPALEMTDALYSSTTDQAALESHTAADMDLYRRPSIKWTVGVQGSRDPTIGTFRVGDTFQVTLNDHAVIPDGTYRRRITGLSGSLSDWVNIESADDYVVQSTAVSGVQVITNG